MAEPHTQEEEVAEVPAEDVSSDLAEDAEQSAIAGQAQTVLNNAYRGRK